MAKCSKEERTCPQYLYHSPFFQSLFELLEDYRKNRIGNVLELPYPLITYLRIIDAEYNFKDNWQDEQYYAKKSK